MNNNFISKIKEKLNQLSYLKAKHVSFHFYKIFLGDDIQQSNVFCNSCKNDNWYKELMKINEKNDENELSNNIIYVCKFIHLTFFKEKDENQINKQFILKNNNIIYEPNSISTNLFSHLQNIIRPNVRQTNKEKKDLFIHHLSFLLPSTKEKKKLCSLCQQEIYTCDKYRHFGTQKHQSKWASYINLSDKSDL